MRLTVEQEQSALEELTRAGVRVGTEYQVLVVTGSLPSVDKPAHLAFCSSMMRVLRAPAVSTPRFQRVLPLQGRILFRREEEIAERLLGRRGFAVMRGSILVHDGVVGFDMDPEYFRVIPSNSPYLRFRDGKAEAADILNQELAVLGV